MKDEIKEILESLDKISKAEYYPEDLLTYKECHLLLDYITNLQTIEQQYSAILSENAELENKITNLQEYKTTIEMEYKRKYAKRYLEERRKEQPNLLYPDSDEIYKRYYELKKENDRLKQTQYVWSYDLDMQLEDYKSRNEKAICYLGNCDWNNKDFEKLYDILQGEDKE